MLEVVLFRALFLLTLTFLAYSLRPFGLSGWPAIALAAAIALSILAAERPLRRMGVPRLLGAAAGLIFGLLCATLASVVLRQAVPAGSDSTAFIAISTLILFIYVGVALGAQKGLHIRFSQFDRLSGAAAQQSTAKLLDTSVIIDGRIGDIAETGFVDGELVVPQFVLRELQFVADSSDSLKRARGRRGLDVLQRLQKVPGLRVRITDEDYPQIREVDLKLLELARVTGSKIVTNDFNLNKIAQLHKVEVLNINDLANAMRPVVLPGEIMRVFVLKEGKEYNQGVAYLDDGTMVVIDNARKMISKTIDVTVTSVLQTTAGKMIFGKLDERAQVIKSSVDGHERTSREAS